MVEVKEIIKLADEADINITIFDLEELKKGLYQSSVCTTHAEKKDLEDVCREKGLSIDLATIVYDLFISNGTLSV